MVKVKSFIEKFYVAFIGFLLYAPLLVLFVCSFNDSKARTIWGGFTLHWYTDLFQNEEVLSAVRTSLLLTTLAALIATLIGTLACIGMTAMKLRFQKVMEGLANIPLLNADSWRGKYSNVECRYCNRCGYHAFVCAFHVIRIYLHVDSSCNAGAALYYFECYAEISAAG